MKRVGKLLIIGGALFLLSLAGGYFWVRYQLETPHQHDSADASIVIERGLGTRAIIDRLAEANIISSRYPLLFWTKLSSGVSLKAGEYQFDSPITSLQVLKKLQDGAVVLNRVTIPEGLNRFEIAAILAEKTGKANAAKFEQLMNSSRLIADLAPQANNLEGYLFPETYSYTSETTPEEMVKMMVERFKEVCVPAWRQRAEERGQSIHEIVTIASMIEKETRVTAERPLVASVFYNRIAKGIPLASDPTFVYAAILVNDYDGNVNQPRHRERNSPYNTYKVQGTPPGPIASPGQKSIEAALYPAESDFYFFVATGTDGGHKFSRTLDEHNRAVAQYRRVLQMNGNR